MGAKSSRTVDHGAASTETVDGGIVVNMGKRFQELAEMTPEERERDRFECGLRAINSTAANVMGRLKHPDRAWHMVYSLAKLAVRNLARTDSQYDEAIASLSDTIEPIYDENDRPSIACLPDWRPSE